MPYWGRPTVLPLGIAVTAMLLILWSCGSAPATAASCTKFASAAGSDSASGSAGSPYQTAQKLFDSLFAGQTGCLAPGQTFSVGTLRANRSGTPGNPVTLTSAPGGRATVQGHIFVPEDAADIVFENLVLNAAGSGSAVSPSVNGDRITFRGNDITDDNNNICFNLGKDGSGGGVAEDIVIDSNRIYRCGQLPATGFDHAIYLHTTRNARITNNYIYDNADYGIHLYPNAQGTLVANNVIDGNGRGVTFSGEGSTASSNNLVVDNIISNSKDTANIESYWGGPVGTGNRAEGNCLWNGAEGNINTSQGGFTATNNIVADPQFVDRGGKSFALRASSPCAGKGPKTLSSSVGGTTPLPPAGPAKRARKRGALVASASWAVGRKLVVKLRSRPAGRAKVVARIGDEVVGTCLRTLKANGGARCRFSTERIGDGAEKAVISIGMKPRTGAMLRLRLVRNVPELKTLTATAALTGEGIVVGVRSEVPGALKLVARAAGAKIGQCNRRVGAKSVSCRFAVTESESAAGGLVVRAALKPKGRQIIKTSVKLP